MLHEDVKHCVRVFSSLLIVRTVEVRVNGVVEVRLDPLVRFLLIHILKLKKGARGPPFRSNSQLKMADPPMLPRVASQPQELPFVLAVLRHSRRLDRFQG